MSLEDQCRSSCAIVAPARKLPDRRADLFLSLDERIRNADSKSPADMAKLAAEVEERMQDLGDVEPEIRTMLLKRRKEMALKDEQVPPRTPEAAKPEKFEPVLRMCCCGCGEMRVAGSHEDAAFTQLCQRHLADPKRLPQVNASAQRAYSDQLSRPRKQPTAPSEEVTPSAASRSRLPNYDRLQEMAKPREPPPPPPPEPLPFRAMPAPGFAKPLKSPSNVCRPSYSAPDLRMPTPPASSSGCQPTLGLRARDSLRQLSLCAAGSGGGYPTPDGATDGASAKLVDLRCHALKNKCFMLPLDRQSLPALPSLGQDFADELSFQKAPENKRHVSESAQRRYTEDKLYRKPANGGPGSVADLQAKLDALKKENKARDRQLQKEERQQEKLKRPAQSKWSRNMPVELIC